MHITMSDHVEMFTDWGKIKATDKTLIGNFNAREVPLLLFFFNSIDTYKKVIICKKKFFSDYLIYIHLHTNW